MYIIFKFYNDWPKNINKGRFNYFESLFWTQLNDILFYKFIPPGFPMGEWYPKTRKKDIGGIRTHYLLIRS